MRNFALAMMHYADIKENRQATSIKE